MKNCTALLRKAHVKVKSVGTIFEAAMSKSARLCGAKHISKSKCTKHIMFGPLLEVEMSKKCTPLWREAHFEVKMLKHHMLGPLFDVQMPFRVAGARDCAPCQK